MKIFDEEKINKIEVPDLERGYLKPDRIFVEIEEGERVPITTFSDGTSKYGYFEDVQVYVPFTEEEIEERNNKKRYAELKAELAKIKEDIEQETFGLVRGDYAEKRARASAIVNELRVLEGKEPREVNT